MSSCSREQDSAYYSIGGTRNKMDEEDPQSEEPDSLCYLARSFVLDDLGLGFLALSMLEGICHGKANHYSIAYPGRVDGLCGPLWSAGMVSVLIGSSGLGYTQDNRSDMVLKEKVGNE